MNVPSGIDPREFALQLAVVSERLDERSALAAQRMEQASVHLEQRASDAVKHLAAECARVGAAHESAIQARGRMFWMLSVALLAGAFMAAAWAAFAVGSARRELASLQRDRTLTHAINQADLTLCGDRLCARIEGSGGDAGAYRPIALR